MKELIGKKFKRNKYGLSTWTDKIIKTSILWSAKSKYPHSLDIDYYIPIIRVHGSKYVYDLSEIVIVEE